MNKFLKILLITILILINGSFIYADDNKYEVINIDGNIESLLVTSSFDEAYSYYFANINEYKNLCLYENDKALYMEYGTMYFNSNDEKITYYSETKDEYIEVSNYNEYDLLYLGEDNGIVKFIVENDIGYIEKELVTYFPYGTRSISYYDLINDSLYYHVSSLIDHYYKYNFMLDEKLSYMNSNVQYFSYDGHFFYDDFYKMSDDYASYTNQNSINKDDPYYNYYAYLPLRSYSNYSADDFNNFIKETLGIEGRLNSYSDFDKDGANDSLNLSELYDTGRAFVSSEKIYGVNALSNLSFALLESNYGKSLNAYKKSNLFNHEALDAKETTINKYSSITSSIYSNAENFISRKYCDIFTTYYRGSFIGDFASGIGSFYSYNPLFSKMYIDKAYFIDKSLGLKDKGEYTIALSIKNISLYSDKELKSAYKTFRYMSNSYIVEEEGNDYLKVQNVFSTGENGEYNPLLSSKYLKKSLIDRVIEGRSKEIEYKEYKVDFRFYSDEIGVINLYSKNDFDVTKEFVYKDLDGFDTDGYEKVNELYVPIYKKIKSISLEGLKYPAIKNNEAYVKDFKLHITYEDNTSKKINITSDEIVNVTNTNNKTTLNFHYKGLTKQIDLNGNFSINNQSNSIEDFVIDKKYNYSHLSFNDVKDFDNKFILDETISTYIEDNDYDFSVEGANPNFVYYKTNVFPKIINTYYFDIKHINDNVKLNKLVSNFNLSYVDSINIYVSRSLYHIDFIAPMVMQVKLLNVDPKGIYTVYYKEKDGTFTKLPTEFSNNYVRFITNSDGDFYIYKYNGASSHNLEDSPLNIKIEDNGNDYYDMVLDGLIYIVFVVIGYLMIALYYILRRKEERSWKDFKNSLQKAESPQEEKLKS